ncbi:hypothetical protein ACFSTC_14415 [Nonomuraea ferruginea]
MMKFPTKEDVPDAWGPENDPALPNWSRTRYVEWTSWQASSTFWPNARFGIDSVQAESSGMAVYAHELSHIMGIADNYNNPYGVPPRRAYTGIWEMLSRGSFNGPGGPHSRWLIPPTAGASMGAQHMLRNKIKLEMVDERNVLRLSREALDESGLVTAKVTARAVQPGDKGLSGINIAFDTGDKSPACDPGTDPMCDGGGYDNYTVEVVDRMGSDSFTPRLRRAPGQDQERRPGPVRVGDRRQPAGHRHDRLRDARRHRGADHDRRLPAAVRRALPRRHGLRQRVRVRRRGQPAALLHHRRAPRPQGHPVLHRGDPLPRRRGPAAARRAAAARRRLSRPARTCPPADSRCSTPAGRPPPRGSTPRTSVPT